MRCASLQAKGTKSTSFLTCVRNEVDLEPLACKDVQCNDVASTLIQGFHVMCLLGNRHTVNWALSGRVLDLRLRGCRFEPHRCHCVVSLSKTHLSLLSTGSTQEDPSRHN